MARKKTVRLPDAVVSVVDLARLQRELTALDESLNQAAIRQPGTQVKLPRTTRSLEDMAKLNDINLLQSDDRTQLLSVLEETHNSAPVLHMSFAADPSAAFIGKVITWLRSEVHPLVLLQIGLQPSIAAGCIVRTPNKQLDFSLRENFMSHRDLLIEKLRASKYTAPESADAVQNTTQKVAA